MLFTPHQLVQQIHDTPTRVVLAAAGGGSRAIADLLEVSGGSRTLLEAVVPYSAAAMIAFLGSRPDEFCAAPTARTMAMAAFHRARRYEEPAAMPAGVACTASLASDRPKRGPHRIHAAMQTAAQTAAWSLPLHKDRRTRGEEERLAGQLMLNVVAEACGIASRLKLDLLEGENVEESHAFAPQPWQDLLLGKIDVVQIGNDPGPAACIFPGAFHPWHAGHCRMVQVAQEILQRPVAVELSILNVDKPPLDYMEIERRLGQLTAAQAAYLTRAATFEEKSRLFPAATFVVGVDTLQRIAAPCYYGGNSSAHENALREIADRDCHFLVFGRTVDGRFLRLSDLDLPEPLRPICREIPPDVFREDISSTAIRQADDAPP
jgi:nicotinamide mononucleotide (NMN) deamidase PncC